jgi:hypothetical protein
MKIIERTCNAETGETIDIQRDETVAEKKIRESSEKEYAATQSEAEAKAIQRQLILDKLGLTSDEAKLLIG